MGCLIRLLRRERRFLRILGDEITLSVTVSNTGEVRGKEVVQVYVKVPAGETGKSGEKADWVCEDEGAGTWRAGRGLYCYSEV